MIIETFRQAIQNVWSNKLRTFLTMLGIIIGVMAVIVIVGLGNGMTKSMRDSFSALGTNTLSVQVWGNGSRTVPVEEMYKLPTKYPELIQSISPQINFSGSGTLKIGTNSYRWSTISGVDENYSAMKNYQIAQGRGLQYMDIKDNKQVCVIGDYLNRVAFGGNGLGQTLKIGANKFRIVGVLAAKVSDPDMQQGSDDDCVYLPYTTVMRLSSQSMVSNYVYVAVMEDENRANEAKSAVESELQHQLGSDNGYYVYSASEWLEEMNKMINMVIVILTGIASISLLVGGIGIMNIMLVSVTERTREIGIRKALGAKERTILSQFVVEAATTSALGGVLGIALGYIVSMVANRLLPMFTSGTTVTVSPSFNSIAVAFGISVGIGVLFGYLPAKRAARLNPIEALRYD
ncbi:MAG: ABC transporter permease [Faecalibacterium prausnitzii]|nr:ABC transporter permease [Faecalibacterium prausnitzii]